jgi:hypothetical protein
MVNSLNSVNIITIKLPTTGWNEYQYSHFTDEDIETPAGNEAHSRCTNLPKPALWGCRDQAPGCLALPCQGRTAGDTTGLKSLRWRKNCLAASDVPICALSPSLAWVYSPVLHLWKVTVAGGLGNLVVPKDHPRKRVPVF